MRQFRVRTHAGLFSSLCLSLILPSVVRAQQPQQPPPTPQPGRRRQPGQPTPQTPTPTPDPQQPQPGQPGRQVPGGFPGGAGGRFGQAPAVAAKPRPYAEVVTKEAKTDIGLIKTHQIDDRVLFELPTPLLGKEILWVTTLRETQVGYGYGGQEIQDRVVRWEKRGDKILLRGVSYQTRAYGEGAIKKSVALSAVEPILAVFDVKAYNDKENNAPVIDVTSLLTGDTQEFSPRRVFNAARLDPSRTFIDKVKSLPENVELDVLSTYTAAPQIQGIPGLPRRNPREEGPRRDTSTDAITAVIHHSVVLLPEKPMKPRLADDRVGFFATGFYEFGSPENRVKRVSYIDRWRLEKKDPNAAVSEPVKPITYYLGPEIPEKWRPYIKQGVEDWQPVFEKAGFKNGIVAKDAPSATEDPNFDADDVRYSVIRWFPSATENAYGPHIADPRTGEILNANPRFFHNVLKLMETFYFVQASPNDKRAQKLPLPDDLMGQILRYVVSHEIGHTLGLRHNKKASSSFSVAQLRDPKFQDQWGDEASIMDYGRFNYVAQPTDGVKRLIPKQGPYDYFAIEWGYKPIVTATPEAEKAELDKLADAQSTNPMLRFGPGEESPDTQADPGQRSEDLGADAVQASTLGLKNLDRVMGYLVSATGKNDDDYDLLQDTYNVAFSQRDLELAHVAALIGGFTQNSVHYGQPGATTPANYTVIPVARQRAAMQFLVQNGLTTPTSMIRPELVSRIQSSGVMDRVLASQARILATLMSDTRLDRMAEYEATSGTTGSYSTAEMSDDLRKGIWSELAAPKVTIDPYRRNLQRTFVELLGSKLKEGSAAYRPVARGVLTDIKTNAQAALTKTTDRPTRLHLLDVTRTIDLFLNPKA